jgi:hypothetical protein
MLNKIFVAMHRLKQVSRKSRAIGELCYLEKYGKM